MAVPAITRTSQLPLPDDQLLGQRPHEALGCAGQLSALRRSRGALASR